MFLTTCIITLRTNVSELSLIYNNSQEREKVPETSLELQENLPSLGNEEFHSVLPAAEHEVVCVTVRVCVFCYF